MYLVVGLGNPGKEYEKTRHNLGFQVIDHLSRYFKAPLNSYEAQAKWGKVNLNKLEFILAKPQTFVNLSGESVKSLLKIFKIPPSQLIVIHDDLDLPLGKIRIKKMGGSGGHKGLQSVISKLGPESFVRLRIGIGRPPGRQSATKYVLSPFTKLQKEKAKEATFKAAEAALLIIEEGLPKAMNKYNANLNNS